ncbi:MAG: hypothetical protein HY616_03995 [Candidatus Rokubacteria bacterium]|nr:hypothetical protein [Candidatus Rokubacteria bacterium]
MGWAGDLLAKLPTLKGMGSFLYVATNWRTISGDFEEYRRQIKDRESWARDMLANQDALHDLAMKLHEEATRTWVDRAYESLEMAKRGMEVAKSVAETLEQTRNALRKSQELTEKLVEDWADCAITLAQWLAEEKPPVRAVVLASLNEASRDLVTRLVDAVLERRSRRKLTDG